MSNVVSILSKTVVPVVMTSQEIAELTGKAHKNVMADVRKMLEALGSTSAEFSARIKVPMPRGGFRDEEVFHLPRDLTETLITGYNTPLRHKVVVRLRELEEARINPPVALGDAATLRGLLLGYTEQVLQLEQKVAEAAPAVEFYENTGNAKDLLSVNAVSRTLGSGQNRLFAYLRKHKIMLSDGDRKNLPMQIHQDAGRFHVNWDTFKDPETGEIRLTHRSFFTGKGAIWIRDFVAMNGREGLDSKGMKKV